MKKFIRLLSVGLVIGLGLSGFTSCDENHTVQRIESVSIEDLSLGYLVTGLPGNSEVPTSIEFCGSNAHIIYSNYPAEDEFFELIEDVVHIGPEYFYTSNSFIEIGMPYYFEVADANWTVTSIEKEACSPDDA